MAGLGSMKAGVPPQPQPLNIGALDPLGNPGRPDPWYLGLAALSSAAETCSHGKDSAPYTPDSRAEERSGKQEAG